MNKNLAHIKMSQMDWKKNPSQFINKPKQDNSTSLSPRFRVPNNVLEKLRKIDALGFDLSNYQEMLSLMQFQADPGMLEFMRDVGAGGPDELQLLQQAINKKPGAESEEAPAAPMAPSAPMVEDTSVSMDDLYKNPTVRMLMETTMDGRGRSYVPNLDPNGKPRKDTEPEALDRAKRTMQDIMGPSTPKVSMKRILAQMDPSQLELMGLLMDAGFAMDDLARGREVLQRLSMANSPFGPLAKTLVNLPDANLEALIAEAAAGMHQDPGGVILDQTNIEAPPPPSSIEPEEESLMTVQEPLPTPPKGLPAAPPAPPAPAMTPKPTQTKGTGAMATSKQLAETVNKFEELKTAVPPGVKPLNWGDNAGVRVKTKDGRGHDVAKGGMLLKNYGTTEDGILVGVAPGNRLYVRVPPELGTAEWDPAKDDIRISMHDKKWKPEGY